MSTTDADRAKAADAIERGAGICRTCLAPIWNEGGTVGHRKRAEGWTDRIETGGDSLVCFKAIDYRHVPLTGREAAIYDRAFARGAEARAPYDRLTADLRALAEEWEHEAQRHDDAEPISADGLTRMILAARHCREHARPLRGLVTGNSEEECGARIGRTGRCDMPKGHAPISEPMGWLHSETIRPASDGRGFFR